MVVAPSCRRDWRTFVTLLYGILIFVAAVYYLFLVMDGSLNLLKLPETAARGMVFNSMLEHMLHGEFDVDPSAIAFEGSLRDGKTYTYFGILPALLRLPLLAISGLAWLDVTGPYCALAATVALGFKLASVALINHQLPRNRLQATALFVLVLSLLLGGAQIQFLRATLYQETLEWAGAISAAFIYCALRGLIAKREFSAGLIALMAGLAGLGLLTRVSTALGLYFASGLLIVVLAWPSVGSLRERLPLFFRGLASKQTVVGLGILLGFVALAGIVNYQRWGNPLEFYYDPHTYIGYTTAPWRLARLETYGVFNIGRLWYGILYYFFPIWTISRSDGQFLFSEFETRMLDAVETPPGSFLLSDPLLLVLAGAYLMRLPRLARERRLDPRATAALMIGLLIPVFLILTFMYMAFRYRMEFYPFLEFSAFLGFYTICVNPAEFSALSRRRLSLILIAIAGFGIVGSHFTLFLHKISPPGNYVSEGADAGGVSPENGWVDYYRYCLRAILPSLAQRLHL
jgi:hypothetical protein